MPQFLVDPCDVAGDRARVRGSECRHLKTVLRLEAGDGVTLFDGRDRRWTGRLTTVADTEAVVDDLRPEPPNEPPVAVELLQGVPKGDRWEWILEKGCELGASRFRPVITRRTVYRPRAGRLAGQLDRWHRRLVAAAKQCERARVPEVAAPEPLAAVLDGLGPVQPSERRVVCVERLDTPRPLALEPAALVRVAVGPEGGWADDELAALEAAGFTPLGLGPRVLRADTAAVAALVRIQALWGDLEAGPAPW